MIEKQDLLDIARQKMPFGKYEGRLIVDLPEEYLLWFNHKGWPEGKLGRWLQLSLEVKVNGLEKIVEPLKLPETPKPKQPKVQIRFDEMD